MLPFGNENDDKITPAAESMARYKTEVIFENKDGEMLKVNSFTVK